MLLAAGGDNLRIIFRGKNVPDYGTVQGIFMGCTSAFLVVMTIIGPEYVFEVPRASNLELIE